MRSEQDIQEALDQYADMIRRICLCHLKNHADTEDVFQDVFVKYLLYEGTFENSEHQKAWFIRVTVNACKDKLRFFSRHKTQPLSVLSEEQAHLDSEQSDVLEAVLSLPDKYKDAIYLHYYEGYTSAEIGSILKKKENTIYSRLSRGRALLKKQLGGEKIEELHS